MEHVVGKRAAPLALDAEDPTTGRALGVSPNQRVVRRRVGLESDEDDSGGQQHHYGRAINPDLQREIMWTLFKLDPLDALRLAATDRQHCAILESLESSIVRLSALMPTDAPLTAYQLLAANVGLSRRLAGGTSPQDWEAAVAASVMEGFVRYLFMGGRYTLAATRAWGKSTADARYFDYDTDHAGDAVSAILEEMTLEQRVRALYEWIMMGTFGAYHQEHQEPLLGKRLGIHGVCKGYLNRQDYGRYLSYLRAVGRRVGDQPRGLLHDSGSAKGLAMQPILRFPQASGGLFPDFVEVSDWLILRAGPSGEKQIILIDSCDAEIAIRDHIDDMVRRHMHGPGAWLEADGRVALPTFSDFFPGAICMANTVPDVTMFMDLRSPRIECLLGELFDY